MLIAGTDRDYGGITGGHRDKLDELQPHRSVTHSSHSDSHNQYQYTCNTAIYKIFSFLDQ